nr:MULTISPECIES: RHS domain-containing protein [unclassified Enterobacter cloacae complex]
MAHTDDVNAPEIFWFHCQPNGTPERIVDIEGQMRWEGGTGLRQAAAGKRDTAIRTSQEVDMPKQISI